MEIKITRADNFVTVYFEPLEVLAFDGKPVKLTSVRLDMDPDPAIRVRASFRGHTMKKDGSPRSGNNFQYIDSDELAEEIETSVRAALKTFEEEEHV